MWCFSLLLLLQSLTTVFSAPALIEIPDVRDQISLLNSVPSGYAPLRTACPEAPLVRPAKGLSKTESTWLDARRKKASVELVDWLQKHGFENLKPEEMPLLGLATSGGGFRSALVGAGVHKALDSRDSDTSTSGLLGAISYESGLSGGGLLLTSISGNGWPTISNLTDTIWKQTIPHSPLKPKNLREQAAELNIGGDLLAKEAAGFDPTLVDPYGRLFSHILLNSSANSNERTTSSLRSLQLFQDHSIPYPIITALNIQPAHGGCSNSGKATQFEFGPFESGSWDEGIAAFTKTEYLGTSLTNGMPDGDCITNFDDQGYITGTSANVYGNVCAPKKRNLLKLPLGLASSTLSALGSLLGILEQPLSERDVYGTFPNPFKGYPSATSVHSVDELSLVDGGGEAESIPLWPLLHRPVDAILISDNNDDDDNGYPSGHALRLTYRHAKKAGLKGMPVIPEKDEIARRRFNGKGPLFFGCNDPEAKTLIWLPNEHYSHDTTAGTLQWVFSEKEIDQYIANGVEVATHGSDEEWATCLGCGLMKKSTQKLPDACGSCFERYCMN